MRRWSVGINNYYFTSCIYLDEAPWYVFALENTIQQICSYFPSISLPKIKITMDGEETTLKEWYGSTSDLFHIFICAPISEWCFKKTETKYFQFPYEFLKERFPEDFKGLEDYWTESDNFDEKKELKENEEYSKKIGEVFNEAYKKLQTIEERRRQKGFFSNEIHD
jgi:hypothetical protein